MRLIFLLLLVNIACAQSPHAKNKTALHELEQKIQALKNYETQLLSEQQYYNHDLKMNRLSSLRTVSSVQEKSQGEIARELVVVREKVKSMESDLKQMQESGKIRISSQESDSDLNY